jgi:anti-anti-sigma factor
MKSENPGLFAVLKPALDEVSTAKSSLKLRIEAVPLGNTVVLCCRGQTISRSDARALSRLISEVLPTARRIIVDLEGVVSLDSDGLGELVLTHMWAEAARYALKFSTPSDSVRRLFESTNLISVLDVYASAPEAMAAMRGEEVQPA